MAFRFQKRISLFPGVRLNLSKGMPSLSIGPRGASLTVGKRGVYGNVGIPGSGLSYRTRLDKQNAAKKGRQQTAPDANPTIDSPDSQPVLPVFKLRFAGAVPQYLDDDENPLSDADIAIVKKHYRDQLIKHFETRAADLNEERLGLGKLHHDIKPPAAVSEMPTAERTNPQSRDFPVAKPERPGDPEKLPAFMEALSAWRVAKTEFEAQDNTAGYAPALPDLEAIATPILARLGAVEWPRETNIDVDLSEDGQTLILHVDLPEIEDMPTRSYSVSRSTVEITSKDVSATANARLYADHVHAIALRLVGEAFSASGALRCVQLDGYTQRISTATGQMSDQYVLSLKAPRERWENIDFDNLAAIDPVAAVERFEMRRNMLSRGHLKEIEPFRT